MRHSKPVRLETAPTGPDKSGSKPRGESAYLFLESTIILRAGQDAPPTVCGVRFLNMSLYVYRDQRLQTRTKGLLSRRLRANLYVSPFFLKACHRD